MSLNALTSRFPYYIVRFKHRRYRPNRIAVLLFPYYIVRFKLNNFSTIFGFFVSFHTTQYDLNTIFPTFHFVPCLEFPYYIVRFKLSRAPTIPSHSLSFPYYIVRFKHCLRAVCFSDHVSFHTTQYDLNKLLNNI